jgi:hypothetical protein
MAGIAASKAKVNRCFRKRFLTMLTSMSYLKAHLRTSDSQYHVVLDAFHFRIIRRNSVTTGI